MPYLYLFQLARSKYGYRQYLGGTAEERGSLLQFAFWRTNMCRWLEAHAEGLSRDLSRLAR